MIVDCHTKIWTPEIRYGVSFEKSDAEALAADASRLLEVVEPIDRAIVLAFKSRYLDAEIPNRFVSECVARHSDKLIGFAGIDPTDEAFLDELHQAQDELRLRGVTISPALQDFHPADTRAMALYEESLRRGLPVVFENEYRCPAAKLEYARPALLDEVAREYPSLRLIIAHMGFPYLNETVALLSKHENVYADVSGLVRRPWTCYNALMAAFELGVMDKLLFGSDFPFRMPVSCIEALYSINQVTSGTNLITIPRELLRGIIERDALTLLGLDSGTTVGKHRGQRILDED